MIPQDTAQALQAICDKVREIAAANPDTTYTRAFNGEGLGTCQYKPDDHNPHGCLIGYAARECGYSLDDYPDQNDQATVALAGIGFDLDLMQWCWLDAVQMLQDEGRPWAEAVAGADRRAANN